MPPAELLAFLERHGISFPEWNILVSVGYGICGADYLVEVTVGESHDRFGTVTETEAEEALQACLREGWLQVVDEAALSEMRDYLRARQVTDHEGALPRLGEIDFTPAGAERYRQLLLEWDGPDWGLHAYFVHRNGTTGRLYSRTLEGALDGIEGYREQATRLSEPVPVGPWCVSWWEVYPEGYRVDLQLLPDPEDENAAPRQGEQP